MIYEDLNPHRLTLPDDVEEHLRMLAPKVTILLEHFGEDRRVNSGYRDAALQAKINPKVTHSAHTSGNAADLSDLDGRLDAFCLANLDLLERLNLYLEDPKSTPRWCHVQQIAPKSGHRVFIP